MIGSPWRLSRRLSVCALLGALLILPASALAQNGAANSAASLPPQGAAGGAAADDILGLDIEQLARTPVVVPSMDIPVTSVTKELSTVGRSAAAIFVITNEMIRRSGATCIPDALRMAPGVEVMQVNSNTWSITIRGFSYGPYCNKLLVLIDGRTVYNPDFAGVYWNVQDVLLEDVARIEVIRGPGGTLWGANAVNGVINIITKKAKDTQGTYVMAGGGSHLRDTEAFRYGGSHGDDLQYRVYGKHFEVGENYYASNNMGPANDSWRQGRFGFRVDWQPDADNSNEFTVQGDHYLGSTSNSIIPTSPTIGDYMTGENLLMRWRHIFNDDSDWTLQAYYDNYFRQDELQTQNDKTLDIDFQYRFPVGNYHSITCGAGFRNVQSYFAGGDTFTDWFPTPYWTTNYPSQFIQDEISLADDRLVLTLGCKLEEDPYTGLQYQPTIRLLWAPDNKHSLWGAISRAVHTPTRSEEQVSFTGTHFYPSFYQRAEGSDNLVAESMIAYELGYRTQASEKLSYDIATFYNVYKNIILSDEVGAPFIEYYPLPPHLVVPSIYHNATDGRTCGVELAATYKFSETWKIEGQYTFLFLDLDENRYGYIEDWDPHNLFYIRSSWDLGENFDYDLILRYVDRLVDFPLPKYITMDMRLAWRPNKRLELALVGQNLLQQHHAEAYDLGMAYYSDVVRSVYATATWRF